MSFSNRPLFVTAVLFSGGIILRGFFPLSWFCECLVLLGACAGILLCRRHQKNILLLVCAIIFCLGCVRFHWDESLPKGHLANFISSHKLEQPVLQGVVISQVDEDRTFYGQRRQRFLLAAQRLTTRKGEKPLDVQGSASVVLRQNLRPLQYGDRLAIKGQLRIPQKARNPGGFDNRAYWRTRNVRVLFYSDPKFQPLYLGSERRLALVRFFHQLRSVLVRRVNRDFRDKGQAAFLNSLILGYRLDLETSIKDLFFKTGTIHLLAVSGFNIAFVLVMVTFLLSPLRVHRKLLILIQVSSVWFYCLLVGFQSPVVRASVMATILLGGAAIGRRPDLLNSLGLAALSILIVRPAQINDLGFQLSFLSVWGLAVLLPVFCGNEAASPAKRLTPSQRIVFYFKQLFWMSFVCQLVTLPVTLQTFYFISPVSLMANMAVVPLTFVIFCAGVVYFITVWWAAPLLGFLAAPMSVTIEFLFSILQVCENIPGSVLVVGRLERPLWMILILGIILFSISKRFQRPWLRAVFLGVFLCEVIVFQQALRFHQRHYGLTMLDVGQGDSIYVELENGKNILVDTGAGADFDRGRYVSGPFLRSKGIRSIDALIVTHPQEDHMGGAKSLIEDFAVKKIIFAEPFRDDPKIRSLLDLIRSRGGKAIFVKAGDRLGGLGDAIIEVLNPPADYFTKDINELSLVIKITYRNTRILLAADIKNKGAQALLSSGADLKSDIFKIPHHGARLSATGQSFFNQVRPRISLISVAERNPFGHPSGETIRLLNQINDNHIFRTDRDGAIEITLRPDDKYLVKTILSDTNLVV